MGRGSLTADVRRGDVYLIDLRPTLGGEIRKVRPGVVVSPDELNAHADVHIVAPLTTGSHDYPFRVQCRFRGTSGHVVLDQIRAVDRVRLVKFLGRLGAHQLRRSLLVLREMFAD